MAVPDDVSSGVHHAAAARAHRSAGRGPRTGLPLTSTVDDKTKKKKNQNQLQHSNQNRAPHRQRPDALPPPRVPRHPARDLLPRRRHLRPVSVPVDLPAGHRRQLAARRRPAVPADHAVRVHRPPGDAERRAENAHVGAGRRQPGGHRRRAGADAGDLGRVVVDSAARRLHRHRDRSRRCQPGRRAWSADGRRPHPHRDGVGHQQHLPDHGPRDGRRRARRAAARPGRDEARRRPGTTARRSRPP